MNISEFSRKCGLSAHTLRYYEKIGLLPAAGRNTGNQRDYNECDFTWVEFIKRLKDTGMPLAEIRRYALLREQGAVTEIDRLNLLATHTLRLEDTMKKAAEHLRKLNEKIEFYRNSIEKRKSA